MGVVKRLALNAAVGVSLVSGGFLAARAHYREYRPGEHAVRRAQTILSQAKLSRFDTIIFGDSITEFAYLPDICSGPVLNAGIAGGRLSDVEGLLPQVLAAQRPKRIVFAIGLNDANRANPTDPADFGRRYAAIVRMAERAGIRVRVATIAPVALNLLAPGATFDAAHIVAFNIEIEKLGKPLAVRARMAGPDGSLPGAETTDGAHLTPDGYAPWEEAIKEGCAA